MTARMLKLWTYWLGEGSNPTGPAYMLRAARPPEDPGWKHLASRNGSGRNLYELHREYLLLEW